MTKLRRLPSNVLAQPQAREATCPACGHHVAVDFFKGRQPLATLAWPKTAAEAVSMRRLALDFLRCVDCGHIYNVAFDYAEVPYSSKPNLMFNQGSNWSAFIRHLHKDLARRLPDGATAVEIGHGDGSFLAGLAQRRPDLRCIGFDPNGAARGCENVELRAVLFDPITDLPALKPAIIISRHVLEHLANPLGFLQKLTFATTQSEQRPLIYLEVPCVDRMIESGRTVDLYYEHSSQFTTKSFTSMLTRAGCDLVHIGHGYDGEVVFGLAELAPARVQMDNAHVAASYQAASMQSEQVIRAQLSDLFGSGERIAIWGGTGKSAAFMNRYQVDAERFPIVVDSDVAKAGTFVPGTGQEIRFRDYLHIDPPEVIIVPAQWRAQDIIEEMERCGITARTILIEHAGKLIDFRVDSHPYRIAEDQSQSDQLAAVEEEVIRDSPQYGLQRRAL